MGHGFPGALLGRRLTSILACTKRKATTKLYYHGKEEAFRRISLALIDYICQLWLAKIELTDDNAICAVVSSFALPEPEDGRIK